MNDDEAHRGLSFVDCADCEECSGTGVVIVAEYDSLGSAIGAYSAIQCGNPCHVACKCGKRIYGNVIDEIDEEIVESYVNHLYDELSIPDHETCILYLGGDGWNEPYSVALVCACEEELVGWVQTDPECTCIPTPIEMHDAIVKHFEDGKVA